MSVRSMVWRVVVVLFLLVNLGGAIYAAIRGEVPHATMHVALFVAGLLLVWWFATRGEPVALREMAAAARPGQLDDRLIHLEQSVEAVAIEVERIGEGQRFVARLLTEEEAPVAAPVAAPAPTSATPPAGR